MFSRFEILGELQPVPPKIEDAAIVVKSTSRRIQNLSSRD